jgi:hypothetical protein
LPEPYHIFGTDLVLGANGDLLMVSGVTETQQRLYRRLMTNLGDYIWHLTYGAGLPARVGLKVNAAAITAAVRAQVFQETTVARVPAPTVGLTVNPSGAVICDITFVYAPTGVPANLSVPLVGQS